MAKHGIKPLYAVVCVATLLAAATTVSAQNIDAGIIETNVPFVMTVETVDEETSFKNAQGDSIMRTFAVALGRIDGAWHVTVTKQVSESPPLTIDGLQFVEADSFDLILSVAPEALTPADSYLIVDGQIIEGQILAEAEDDREVEFTQIPYGNTYIIHIGDVESELDPLHPITNLGDGAANDLEAPNGIETTSQAQQGYSCRTVVMPSVERANVWASKKNQWDGDLRHVKYFEVKFEAGIHYQAYDCGTNAPPGGNNAGFSADAVAPNALSRNGPSYIEMAIAYQGGGSSSGPNGFGWSKLTSRGHGWLDKPNDGAYQLIDATFNGRNKNGGTPWSDEAELALDLLPTPYQFGVVKAFTIYAYKKMSSKELDKGPSGDLTKSGITLKYGALTVQKETEFNVKVRADLNSAQESTLQGGFGGRIYGEARGHGGPTEGYWYKIEARGIKAPLQIGTP